MTGYVLAWILSLSCGTPTSWVVGVGDPSDPDAYMWEAYCGDADGNATCHPAYQVLPGQDCTDLDVETQAHVWRKVRATPLVPQKDRDARTGRPQGEGMTKTRRLGLTMIATVCHDRGMLATEATHDEVAEALDRLNDRRNAAKTPLARVRLSAVQAGVKMASIRIGAAS